MGLSTVMNIGANALNVYRVATEVTSENIANVNTPGYSRQRVVLETTTPTTANGFSMGTGVQVAAVQRYYDALLQRQLVNSQATLGYDTTKSMVLQQIEPVFNEIAEDGLGAAISNYFGAWQDLTLNPSGTAERQTLLSRAQILTDNFHSVSADLNSAVSIQNDSLVPLTTDINTTLSSIASLNGQIKLIEQGGNSANETRDQRDQLIRDLSRQIGITYTENSDGTTDISYADGGSALVTGASAGSFSLTVNAGTGFYDVNLTPPAGVAALVAPVTGQLGATVALRDTIIPGYLAQINSLATTITSQVNTQHQLGFDLAGAAGIAFFDPAATNAATFGLNPALVGTSQVAASGNTLLIGDNSNALEIAQLQQQKLMSGNTTTFNTYFAMLVSQVGLDVSSAKTKEAQDVAFNKQLSTLRESHSGVSLDEELANLVKYQRSYQASAKLINTATEMMDTVLNLVR